MNRLLGVLAVALALTITTQADAADPFRTTSDSGISSNALSAMGLSGMRSMDRNESSQIRGQGGVVWGRSYAYATSRNGYSESANGYRFRGRSFAAGANFSRARSGFNVSAAGGFSIAGGF